MATLRILSAGAAQAVVERVSVDWKRDTGHEVRAEFGAVGAMKARFAGGEAVDVIVLTGSLIDGLASEGHVVPGSRADLGKVGTGVAVRAGVRAPDVPSAQALREHLLAANRVVCPDPATATAGKVVMQLLERLVIVDTLRPRMQFFPNGYAAMKWLGDSRGERETGITQITEILANPGVTYAGPLPGDLQVMTVYSAGLAARAAAPGIAREFIARLTGTASRPILAKAGYEFEG